MAACLAAISFVIPAKAAKKFPTKYTYYLVSGSSAGEVHRQLVKRGPSLHGTRAYASTAIMNPRESRVLDSDGKTCRVRSYSFNTSFVINLPKLKNPAALNVSERGNWQTFHAFAKRHEEEHRTIWSRCWNSLNAQAIGLRAPTCDGLHKKLDSLVKASFKACDARHQALDARDRSALKRQPFIRQAQASR
jgi:predicted secreted Zn-dependent protease